MKFLSIDTETTGLDPYTCQILSFSAVLEDTSTPDIAVEDLPHIHVILKHDIIKGEAYALNMNKDIIEIIKNDSDERLIEAEDFDTEFRSFLIENDINIEKIKVAGKNFSSFDKNFIARLLRDSFFDFKFHHRVLDVGPLFIDFKKDEWVPTLDECMQRAGVKGVVTHDALEDARDVIRVLRTKY